MNVRLIGATVTAALSLLTAMVTSAVGAVFSDTVKLSALAFDHGSSKRADRKTRDLAWNHGLLHHGIVVGDEDRHRPVTTR